MTFERIYQFNRIQEHFASDQYLSVHLYPAYEGRFEESSFFISRNLAGFSTPKARFKPAFLEYLQNNGSIGISRLKEDLGSSFETLTDMESLIAETVRSFSEQEILSVLAWQKDFILFQPENKKSLVSGRFRTQTDVLIYSFCFRVKKPVSEIIKNLPGTQPAEIYKSALILCLLGYLSIEKLPTESERTPVMTTPHFQPEPKQEKPAAQPMTAAKFPGRTPDQANALKRLFNKILSI